MSSIGEIFKEKRIERNLTLAEISEAIKISSNYLNSIENNEFKRLPRGIFPKMFIRSYAKYLALDENKMVQLYYEQIAANDTTVNEVLMSAQTIRSTERRARWLVPVLVILPVLAITVISGYFLFRSQGQPPKPYLAQLTPPAPEPAATAPAPATPAPESGTPAAPADTSLPPPALPAAVPEAGEKTVSAAETDIPLSIVIQARQYSWIHLTWDTSNEMDFILKPGDTFQRSFTGTVLVKLGNAGGVTLSLNGKPTRALGAPGQVVSLELSSANYETYLPDPEGKP